jgi:nitroreductase/NAD-dependent dihydropyrimidine dehydrogenase PreA subunit
MGFLTVDRETCRKDGVCSRDCPMAVIRLQDGDGYPEMVSGGEQICIRCGHCVAVCPNGALSHEKIPLEACPLIKKELVLGEEQAVQFLRSRRSIRTFKDKPVEREKIQRLIEIARYAPTGSNSQLVEWVVYTDKEKVKKLGELTVSWMRQELEEHPDNPPFPYAGLIVAGWDAGLDTVTRDAPAVIVASAPRKAGSGLVDLSLALSYLELAAPTMGLGTCWAGLLQRGLCRWQPLKDTVGLAEEHIHFYPMMLGYPKAKYFRLPERKPPKITWR